MTKIHYSKAKFLLSVARLSQLPPDTGIEVAIVGRSNAGKSSVLNQLTQNKTLARVSKTPGRTQLINLFAFDHQRRMADLPGYGYAKVPPAMKQQWQALLDDYLRHRDCLAGLILVMDIRHPLKEFDQQLLQWSSECDIPVHILLNKADKLTQRAIQTTLNTVQKGLTMYSNSITCQAFSALKGDGTSVLRGQLDEWYQNQ